MDITTVTKRQRFNGTLDEPNFIMVEIYSSNRKSASIVKIRNFILNVNEIGR